MKNENQEKVVTNIDGFVLVDAGAGTGKTYTITKRYLNILQQLKKKKKTAQELLLLTFTRNAALNMKSRIIAELEVDDITQVADSMITTFDSLSNKVVASFGIDTPKVLGIKESLTNYNLVINKYVLKKDFNEFFNNYLKNNKPHYDWLCLIKNVDEIRTLLETLASRAIIPTNDGWLLDGEEKLLGSFDEWKSIFDNANIPSKKSKPSVIYAKMKDKLKDKDKVYYQASELLEQKLQISDVTAEKAFKEDRSNAINILRDIYYRYIIHLLQNNIMTFNMISIFSYLTLLHNSDARNAFQHDYVMVDEFQDTNEMQFLTTLLLLKQPNLCVVGDWKQGIFGFRNATIENITDFENRVKKLIATLNTGEQRISFDFPKSIVTVQLTINYRSAQKILDASSFALTSKATQKENLEITEVQKK